MFAQCRCGRVHLEQMTSENSVDDFTVLDWVWDLLTAGARCFALCLWAGSCTLWINLHLVRSHLPCPWLIVESRITDHLERGPLGGGVKEKWVAICFVQIVIICVERLADRNPSSSLAVMSQIKWLTNFLVIGAWQWKTLWLRAELISFSGLPGLLCSCQTAALYAHNVSFLWPEIPEGWYTVLGSVPGQCAICNRSVALFAVPVIPFRIDT